ncbi:MAG TPA: HAD family phosphatase [Ktedonobacterales bacterium]
MAIRAVVFDIGGILEIIPEGGDPTIRFPQMIERWEGRLGMSPGELRAHMREVSDRLEAAGKDREIGTCTEEEWLDEIRLVTGWEQARIDELMHDHWDVYCGYPNTELATFLGSLRPRYKTALLSNSCVGARREEEVRYQYSQRVDRVIYSHEAGVLKPDPRIYAITCQQLDVRPDEIVFLDDVEGNVAAAAAYGLHAVHFHDNAQAIADIEACLAAHSE